MELPDNICQLIKDLQLQPHPEGGFFRETWRSNLTISQANLPKEYTGDRQAGTSILFLLPTGHYSRWHKVRSDELWLHQSGDPLELEISFAIEGKSDIYHLGRDNCFQTIVPGGYWQKAKPLIGNIGYALVGCIVVPGFDFADFELEN
jgi:predicted cupin superfamily sugar epimerase